MNYKINKEELRAALSEKNAVSGIEKHLIQEGLKQIFLGTGPIEIFTPGGPTIRSITPSLETYLLDSKIIEQPVASKNIEVNVLIDGKKITNEITSSDQKPFLTWNYKGLLNNVNFFGTQNDWNATLLNTINKLARRFAEKTGERANVVIASPYVCDIIANTHYFNINSDNHYNKETKMEYLGKLGTKYKIFSDMNLSDDTIVVANSEIFKWDVLNTWPQVNKDDLTIYNSMKILNLEE